MENYLEVGSFHNSPFVNNFVTRSRDLALRARTARARQGEGNRSVIHGAEYIYVLGASAIRGC
jgi:hypothetical protein